MLFREQGITITSILTAISILAISILVEALLPGSEGVAAPGKGDGDGKPGNVKERLRNRLKQSLGNSTREIRCKSGRSIAWHHWGNHQVDPQ